MSAFTNELGKLLDQLKAKVHSIFDSHAVQGDLEQAKQQVTQVVDEAKTDVENLAKVAGADVKTDTTKLTTDVEDAVTGTTPPAIPTT